MNRSLRISVDEWAIALAVTTAKRGTCLRRQVGCVLMDEDDFILATGFNGVASGQPHCNEPDPSHLSKLRLVGGSATEDKQLTNYAFPHACPAAFAESGTMLDGCHAIHAEQNALLRCGDPREIHSCYVTHSPCVTCVKLLMNTYCQHIYFLEPYAHDSASSDLWLSRGEGYTWNHLTPLLEQRRDS